MTTLINHDLRVVNGGTLYMPPWEEGNDKWGNLDLPDVYAISTTQKYPTGTIYRKGMRTFVYTLTDATYYGEGGTAAIIAGYLMESAAERNVLSNSVISGALGANTMVVNMGEVLPANAYAGGFIGIEGAGITRATVGGCQSFQIISNTAATLTGSYYSTLTLDGNLARVLSASDDVLITEHPYAKVRFSQSGPYGMTVGVLVCTTAASSYLWLQTGGPCNMLHSEATLEGNEPCQVPIYAFYGASNRATGPGNVNTSMGLQSGALQRIGYSYASSDIGGPVGGTPTADTLSMSVWLTILN